MLRNYLLIAIRNILGQKFYAVVNILGLAIGIACFILISLWVKDELSYDKGFKNADRIYRIENSLVTKGVPAPMAAADPRIAEQIRAYYPEIENVTRAYKLPSLISSSDNNVYETDTYFADSTFFDIFSFEFVAGDPKTALQEKGSIVISEEIAAKLFGGAYPIGKAIYINNPKTRTEKKIKHVTGVIRSNSFPSHFHPRAIVAKFWYMDQFEPTYVLFKKGYDPKRFTSYVWPRMYDSFFRQDYAGDNQELPLYRLEPLTHIHLSGNLWEELEPNGNITTVYIFSAIGLVILLIASINYINLATARSFGRSREVGVRKVLGASRKQIIMQFLTEAVVLSLIALLLALAFVEMTLPIFNTLSDKVLALHIKDPTLLITVLLLAVIVGCLSGLYPAFFISSFQPIKALKGSLDISKHKPTLRRSLVVVQFTLSIIMLVATMVVAKQLHYVKNQDLGFDKNQVLVVSLNDQKANLNKEKIKTALLENPNIDHVSTSFNIPGSEINHTYTSFETSRGMVPILINSLFVDYDYVNAMGLKLVEGKGFDSSMIPTLDTCAYAILNESAVKMLGWKHAVGKRISTAKTYGFRYGYCVGVVRDFHVSSLHDSITPLMLALGTMGRPQGKSNFLLVSVKSTAINNTISFIRQVYESFSLGYPFEYTFMDEWFNRQYTKEEKQKILFNWFAGLSIFISCLGLIGLASFSTRQRTREICIRKISGASVLNIVLLLSADFIRLVFIALVIAIPVAYYVMNRWLKGFAYHTDIGWLIFFIAGMLALLIVIATIGIQSFIAANKDPATVLKYE